MSTKLWRDTKSESIKQIDVGNQILNMGALAMVSKIPDKSYVGEGEQLNYTIEVANLTTVPLESVTLVDIVPQGVTLVGNSIRIDGVTISNVNLATGVALPDLQPVVSLPTTIIFPVQVDTLPMSNPCINTATILFVPQGESVAQEVGSTDIGVTINYPNLGDSIDMVVIPSRVYVGGVLTYTIDVSNEGSVAALDVKVMDILPIGTTLVANSFVVNGVTISAPDLENGVNIGSLDVGEVSHIVFRVKVIGTPFITPVMNQSMLTYEYIVNPNFPTVRTMGNVVSNTVSADVIQLPANLGNTSLFVSKGNPAIGEVVTYTLELPNTGNQTAMGVTIRDKFPSEIILVGTPTVVGSGGPIIGDLTTLPGLSIGDILPGSTASVTFQVRLDTIPNPNPFQNVATITYSDLEGTYSFEAIGGKIKGGATTGADLGGMLQKVDNTNPQVGEVVTYTITIPNGGPGLAQNVVIYNALSSDVELLAPVTVVGSTGPVVGEINVLPGLSIGDILAGDTVVIHFRVLVVSTGALSLSADSIVQVMSLPDTSGSPTIITYTDSTGTNTDVVSGGELTLNTITGSNLTGASKSVNKPTARVGETLTYSISIPNTGEESALEVTVLDILPAQLSILSVTVTGATGPVSGDLTVTPGLFIGAISEGDVAHVTFEVAIDGVPIPPEVSNQATITYTDTQGKEGLVITPAVVTSITVPSGPNFATSSMTSDVTRALLGDTIVYTIVLENTGDQTAVDTILIDTLPEGLSYVLGSGTINGNPTTVTDYIIMPIGDLIVGSTTTIVFAAVVTGVIIPSMYAMESVLVFDSPTGTHYEEALVASPPVDVSTGYIDVEDIVISSNKQFVTIGDDIQYTIRVTNSGTSVVEDAFIEDIVPVGASFVVDSVEVNGVTLPDVDPLVGVTLPAIAAQTTLVVTYHVKVDEGAPNPLVLAPTLVYRPVPTASVLIVTPVPYALELLDVNIVMTKTVDRQVVAVGEEVTFEIVAQNRGSIDLIDLRIADVLNPALSFVEGSVRVDGIVRPADNVLTGVRIAPLYAGEAAVLSFRAKVVQRATGPITNTATGVASIEVPLATQQIGVKSISALALPPSQSIIIKVVTSTEVILIIEDPKLSIVVEMDKTEVVKGDIVNVRVNLINIGDTFLTNIILRGGVSGGGVILRNTFTVNGIGVNDVDLEAGLNVGSLDVGENTIVTYQIEVVGGSCNGLITNSLYALYEYVLSSQGVGYAETNVVESSVVVAINSFKQVAYSSMLTLNPCSLDIRELDDVAIDVVVVDSYVVHTIQGESNERQLLTGKKLMIHSMLQIEANYIADEPTQSIYTDSFKIPISSFIILPGDFGEEMVEVTAIVEQVDGEKNSSRTIDISLMILFVAQIS